MGGPAGALYDPSLVTGRRKEVVRVLCHMAGAPESFGHSHIQVPCAPPVAELPTLKQSRVSRKIEFNCSAGLSCTGMHAARTAL